ncbi:MAG TPA: transcription termination factor Rho [Phycisphaerae bacterium]|nr:transcription termination factor Rho [Phycisphaerae bacterium]
MAEAGNSVSGTFEGDDRNGGYLRDPARGYRVQPNDPRVSSQMVRRYGVRGGESIRGSVKTTRGKQGRRSVELVAIESVNDRPAEECAEVARLTELTAVDPQEAIWFETEGGPLTMRVVDLMTPIGRGQRGLIVAPPRTGKTVLLRQMAGGVATNYPDVYVMVLLIDERPEEVTEMRRNVHGEVVASSNDLDVASHVRIARLMIEKAKRMVERGTHVFVLLDSLTRVGRAFNAFAGNSGRIMSGGLDSRALIEPKAIFGAARNIENGGSLTIIATALIDTGSRMDEVIFNEFKGTGNMEIMLSRDLANKRIWPAIDLQLSGTRKEELLLDADMLAASHRIRRELGRRAPDMDMQNLLENLGRFPDNKSFVSSLKKQTR